MSNDSPVVPHTAEKQTRSLSGWSAGGLAVATFGPGVGIVTVPAFTWLVAGSGSALAVLVAAVATACIGLAVITYARQFVASGSLYSYVGEVFGPWAQILTAAGILAGYVCAIGGLLAGVGTYLVSFMLSVGWISAAGTSAYIVVYLVAGAVAATFAYRGLDTSVKVSVGLALISVPAAVVLVIAAIGVDGIDLAPQLDLQGISFTDISKGVATAAAFLVMFESSTALAAETRAPRRNIPRVVMIVPLGLGALFFVATLLQVSALDSLPVGALDGTSPPAALARAAGMSGLADIMDLVVALGLFVAIIGFLNYAPRVAATVATDGLIPRQFAHLDPRFQSPVRAILLVTAVSVGLPSALLLLTAESPLSVNVAVTTLVTYFWIIPYLIAAAGALRILNRQSRVGISNRIAIVVGAVIFIWILIFGFITASPGLVGGGVWIATITYMILVSALSPAWYRLRQKTHR